MSTQEGFYKFMAGFGLAVLAFNVILSSITIPEIRCGNCNSPSMTRALLYPFFKDICPKCGNDNRVM